MFLAHSYRFVNQAARTRARDKIGDLPELSRYSIKVLRLLLPHYAWLAQVKGLALFLTTYRDSREFHFSRPWGCSYALRSGYHPRATSRALQEILFREIRFLRRSLFPFPSPLLPSAFPIIPLRSRSRRGQHRRSFAVAGRRELPVTREITSYTRLAARIFSLRTSTSAE